jgi:hypothetical protein
VIEAQTVIDIAEIILIVQWQMNPDRPTWRKPAVTRRR